MTGQAESPRRSEPARVRHRCGRCGRIAPTTLYILPAIVVMLLVIAYPIYYTIGCLSSTRRPDSQLARQDLVGFDNYKRILTAMCSGVSRSNTLIWTMASTFIAFVLGFAAALVLHREFLGRGIVRGHLLIPWVISAVAASYIWKWIYHSRFRRSSARCSCTRARPTSRRTSRQRQHGAALADRRQHLERVSVRDDHDDGRLADGSRPAPARRAGRRRRRLAAFLARHLAASQERLHGHDPAARGGELQLLHHRLDHDRRRSRRTPPTSGSRRSTSSPSAAPLRRGLGLFRDPVPHHDDAGLLLRASAHPR